MTVFWVTAGSPAKPVLPTRITDYGIRIRSRLLVFGGSEKATESRMHPKYLEVVTARLVAPDSCIGSGVAERHHGHSEGDQTGKGSACGPGNRDNWDNFGFGSLFLGKRRPTRSAARLVRDGVLAR